MGVPAFRSLSGPTEENALDTVWTLDKPAGVVSGDLLLAMFAFEGPASEITGGTVPSGWAVATTPVSIAWPHTGVVFYKIAGGSEPSTYTWNTTVNEGGVSAMLAYTGVDPSTPFEDALAAVAPSDGSPPYQFTSGSVTTSDPDRLLVAMFSMVTNASTVWTINSMDERVDFMAGALVTSMSVYDRVVPRSLTGASFTRTGTATSNGSAQGVEVTLLALTPAPFTPTAPANVSVPVVTGNATDTFTLTCSDGEWTGEYRPVFSYQWKRDGATIGGATSSTYPLTPDDVLTMVSCVVTATNATGVVSQASVAVGPVELAPAAPDTFMMGEAGYLAVAGRLMTQTGLVPPA